MINKPNKKGVQDGLQKKNICQYSKNISYQDFIKISIIYLTKSKN